MRSVNLGFNSVDRLCHNTTDTQKNNSVTLQNSSTSQRDKYIKWAMISAIATATITGAAILVYQYLDNPNVRILPNGCRYEGDLQANLPNGKGTSTCPDGTSYEGDWQKGYAQGKGVYTTKNGTKYEGDWEKGDLHGQGVEILSGGFIKYSGGWKENKYHGKGVYTDLPNGCRYEGYWRDGYTQGKGTQTCSDGTSYEGDWQDGSAHGRGLRIVRSSNGSLSYEGDWEMGMMHGKANVTYADGLTYEVWVKGGKFLGKPL